jgi:hypothetical protein
MNEFVTVSSSSYDPASLATKLTEKAAEGWTVVAIVPTGGDVTAFLSREGGASSAPITSSEPVTATATPEPVVEAPAPEPTPEPVLQSMTPEPPAAEPAGWAVAPEPAPVSSAPATVIAGIGDYSSSSPAATPAYQAAPAAAPAAAATPSVPAGWYADPAGRFELRYWDGGTWTEHVSRAGQQFTDAPVA